MNQSDYLSHVKSLMLDFADRTGLAAQGKEPRRYLWTDSFAVCNFFELYRQTNDSRFLKPAVALIDQVHETLGRHRPDDVRRGWISGLAKKEGREHPTAGGLRIGKALPERRPDEPFDDRLEWDQDGQYFHYLTKWMHALHRASQVTGDAGFNRMARELAHTAHARFTYRPPSGGVRRMYWKMSIDLSRPLVASMGHHDPLDGLITYYELSGNMGAKDPGPDLKTEIDELAPLCRNRDWSTDDPLGLGGLLADAYRVGQLTVKGAITAPELLETSFLRPGQGWNLSSGKTRSTCPPIIVSHFANSAFPSACTLQASSTGLWQTTPHLSTRPLLKGKSKTSSASVATHQSSKISGSTRPTSAPKPG